MIECRLDIAAAEPDRRWIPTKVVPLVPAPAVASCRRNSRGASLPSATIYGDRNRKVKFLPKAANRLATSLKKLQ